MSNLTWDTGSNTLDKFLETGTSLAERYFDWGTAKNEASAQAATRDAESTRLQQLNLLGQSSTVGGVSFPNWTIPVAIGGLILVWYLKKK